MTTRRLARSVVGLLPHPPHVHLVTRFPPLSLVQAKQPAPAQPTRKEREAQEADEKSPDEVAADM